MKSLSLCITTYHQFPCFWALQCLCSGKVLQQDPLPSALSMERKCFVATTSLHNQWQTGLQLFQSHHEKALWQCTGSSVHSLTRCIVYQTEAHSQPLQPLHQAANLPLLQQHYLKLHTLALPCNKGYNRWRFEPKLQHVGVPCRRIQIWGGEGNVRILFDGSFSGLGDSGVSHEIELVIFPFLMIEVANSSTSCLQWWTIICSASRWQSNNSNWPKYFSTLRDPKPTFDWSRKIQRHFSCKFIIVWGMHSCSGFEFLTHIMDFITLFLKNSVFCARNAHAGLPPHGSSIIGKTTKSARVVRAYH